MNKCPICGAKLEYSDLMQFSRDYTIKKNGKVSKKCKNSDVCPMECGFIACTVCDFHTNCDLEVEENPEIKIYQQNDVFMYEDE